MSQFDRYTQADYVDTLRIFLRMKKRTFMVDAGFIDKESNTGRVGRMKKYDEDAVKALEATVNDKSKLAESNQTTFGERMRLARDFQTIEDSDIAKALGVSRQVVACWGSNAYVPKQMGELAEFLNVPLGWLANGPVEMLPANSFLGLRVGDENLKAREQLYSLSVDLIGNIPESKAEDEDFVRSHVEWTVFNNPKFATAARRSGGRWHMVSGRLFFAPWVPIKEHGLARRDWSDEVEAIIADELSDPSKTIYAAHQNMVARCIAAGHTKYPQRISLHKRVDRENERAEKFGLDLNAVIEDSVKKIQDKAKKAGGTKRAAKSSKSGANPEQSESNA